MIVPRTRLILWVAIVGLPFALVGATVPGTAVLVALLVGALVVLAAADAMLAQRRLVGIRVELPELLRLQKDREGVMEVRIHNESAAPRAVRVGIAFPRQIAAAEERMTELPAGAALSRIEWPLTPAVRGQFLVTAFALEAASPLGFWAVRSNGEARSELRVYPNLFNERKNVSAIFLKRGDLGAHVQRRAGQGREFEKLREYSPGDSLGDVHWKASAKRGHPVTKVFQIERTQEVYVLVDASRLSGREIADGRGQTTALERYVTAALILGLAAEQRGDQFGLLTFSDRVLSFVRAKSGQAHYDACRDRLYTLQPQDVSPDFDELCSFIRLRLRKRALLIFLTALDDPILADAFAHASQLISRQHLMLVNMLQPEGAEPLFSDRAPVADLDDIYRRLGGHLQWRDLRELGKVLQRRGIRFAQLDPTRLAAQVVAQHADVKARQLL